MNIKNALLCLALAIGILSCGPSDPRGLIVSRVQSSAKLATVEYVLSKYIFGQKEKKFWIIKLSEAEFVAQTEARVKVGIDLSKIEQDDVRIEGNSLHIKLPPVEIMNFSYPPDKFVVDPILSSEKPRLNIEDIEIFSRIAELQIRRDLHFLGMEKTARERTRTFLKTLFLSMGFEQVFLSFEELPLEKAQYFQETLNAIKKSLSPN